MATKKYPLGIAFSGGGAKAAYDMSKIEDLFFRGYESTVKVLEKNGYQRILPKETIEFPKKKRKKDSLKNSEELFRNTLEKGVAAIKAIKKKK